MRFAALFLLAACTADPVVDPVVDHPKVGICKQCASDVDCQEGLACDHLTFACKTPAMFHAQYVSSETGGQPTCEADCIPPCGVSVHCHLGPGPAWANYATRCIPDDVTCTGDCRY